MKSKARKMRCVKYWEIIADNLSKAGFTLGWVSAIDSQGRTRWIVDAHGYGKRFIVHADEKADCVSGTGNGGLYPPIKRTMLIIITAMAESVSLWARRRS